MDVSNANGTRGIAGKVGTTLTEQGFTLGQTATVGFRAASVVRYAKGEKDNAEKVVAALGKSMTLEQDANLEAGHVVVLLGKDYKDDAPDRLTGNPLLELQPSQPAQPPTSPNGTPCVN